LALSYIHRFFTLATFPWKKKLYIQNLLYMLQLLKGNLVLIGDMRNAYI